MARATYYIKEQTTWRDTEKEEVREVFNSTRKAETERFFNRLEKGNENITDRRMGYFKIEEFTMAGKMTAEYWIEKY